MAKERRAFLKSGFAATSAAAALTTVGVSLVSPALAQTSAARQPGQPDYHHLPANADTVHWGYFSKPLKPQVEVNSGDFVTIETLTHHANDDAERMIKGDAGAESVYLWTREQKGVMRRGAGGGDGGGLGVHICTGPVAVRGAAPGDVLEVRILDVKPRPCANPAFKGLTFGSNAAANWGFQYKDLITGDKPREVVTIYEVDATGERNWAKALYNFKWVPMTDPTGKVHQTIDYPGLPVDHTQTQRNWGVLKNIRVPIRPHFGTMGDLADVGGGGFRHHPGGGWQLGRARDYQEERVRRGGWVSEGATIPALLSERGKSTSGTGRVSPRGLLRNVPREPNRASANDGRRDRRPDQPNQNLFPGHCLRLPSMVCAPQCNPAPMPIQANATMRQPLARRI